MFLEATLVLSETEVLIQSFVSFQTDYGKDWLVCRAASLLV